MTAPIWNGDLSTGDLSQWGGVERKNDNGANWIPVSQRVTVAKTIDGYTSPIKDGYLMRVIVKPEDEYFQTTGWRTLVRQYEPLRQIQAGHKSSYTFAWLVSPSYPGDANPWVAPMQMHQSGATGLANLHVIAQANGKVSYDVYGGALNQAQASGTFACAPGGQWNVTTLGDYLLDPAHGHIEFWGGWKGSNMAAQLTKDCPTMYTGMTCYPDWGGYRAQTGEDDMVIYLAAAREYASKADALDYANQLCAATPPPPDKYAAARAEAEYFRTSSPHIYNTFTETWKANP